MYYIWRKESFYLLSCFWRLWRILSLVRTWLSAKMLRLTVRLLFPIRPTRMACLVSFIIIRLLHIPKGRCWKSMNGIRVSIWAKSNRHARLIMWLAIWMNFKWLSVKPPSADVRNWQILPESSTTEVWFISDCNVHVLLARRSVSWLIWYSNMAIIVEGNRLRLPIRMKSGLWKWSVRGRGYVVPSGWLYVYRMTVFRLMPINPVFISLTWTTKKTVSLLRMWFPSLARKVTSMVWTRISALLRLMRHLISVPVVSAKPVCGAISINLLIMGMTIFLI